MEIKVNDFNYYVVEGIYQFYFLGNNDKINLINAYGIYVDPLETMKTLTLNGLRYNPSLSENYNK